MIHLDMNKPKPVPPLSDFVANFVNNLGNISESIPIPGIDYIYNDDFHAIGAFLI
jgi:hypothetical protein